MEATDGHDEIYDRVLLISLNQLVRVCLMPSLDVSLVDTLEGDPPTTQDEARAYAAYRSTATILRGGAQDSVSQTVVRTIDGPRTVLLFELRATSFDALEAEVTALAERTHASTTLVLLSELRGSHLSAFLEEFLFRHASPETLKFLGR